MGWQPDYLTLVQAKAYLRIDDAADDAEIAGAITAASRAIDTACHRQFGQRDTATTWTYTAVYDRHRPRPAWVIVVDDITDITGLVVSINGTAVTDYTLEPANALDQGKAYEQIVLGPNAEAHPDACNPLVQVTNKFGWAAFPATIVTACKLQMGRFIKRREAPFGIAGSPADGSEVRLLALIDPDVRVQVTSYIRWRSK